MHLQTDRDSVMARQRAKRVAQLMGFSPLEQTHIVTAVSEISRNALLYAGRGRVQFYLDPDRPRRLRILIEDDGPGIDDLDQVLSGQYESRTGLGQGIAGSRRLMDEFDIRSVTGRGTRVDMAKELGPRAPDPRPTRELVAEMLAEAPSDPYEEIQRRNQTLLRVLTELDERRLALEHANRELARANAERARLLELEREVRRQAEIAEREARRAVEVREEVLRVVSHDLRNPVGMVKLSAGLLRRLAPPPPDGDQIRSVGEGVERAADRMTRLIADLLDFAAIEKGQLSLEPRPHDVVGLASEAIEVMQGQAETAGIHLEVTLADGPITVTCDGGRIVQVVQNLVSNAIKFTPKDRTVRVRLIDAPGAARVEVEDEGPGIEPDQLDRIFDRYWQGHRGKKGLGLGLSIALGVVHAHSGAIWVESEPGRGATFVFTLPKEGHIGTGEVEQEPGAARPA